MRSWTTTVTIPELNKKSATTFMEMVYMVSKIAYVPNRAWWKVTSKNNRYTIVATYREYPYYPTKGSTKIRFKLE